MKGSTNPFDDTGLGSAPGGVSSPRPQRIATNRPRRTSQQGEPAIWAARHVEWPIPSQLSLQNYNRLLKASRQAGQQLGISANPSSGGGKSAGLGDSKSGQLNSSQEDIRSDGGTESNYYGLTGFMSRVLNTSAASEKSDDDVGAIMADSHGGSLSSRPIRPPRQGCVATANGWIVAALECPGQSSLRLLSRWNVRRGGTADQWVALPPPVNGNGRILHVFVDPTGSHSLLSAANGEAYYLHSSQKQVIKLAGFGRNADGSVLSKDSLTGVPASLVANRRDDNMHSTVQTGLTSGSYVTAVAWDKERGTEGSSKRILLGTSQGEIYEYSLVSPISEDQDEVVPLPILLHKLYSTEALDPSEVGAAVSGIYFERLRTGLLLLAATSGRSKRTRFYTFYSAHNSSFRMVVADQQHSSLVELPGSVDFADLRLCNDHIGLRTAAGIFYGTIDRSLSGSAVLSGSSSGMIVDSGIMPYEVSTKSMANMPLSLALTPHHLLTLSDVNDVYFINRVAQKIIQKEHVDISSQGSVDESHIGVGELLMDVRRADQVWLRKGRSLVHISSTQEDRDVWKFTLGKCIDSQSKSKPPGPSSPGRPGTSHNSTTLSPEEKAKEALFEQAKALCTNNAQKAVVTAIRAEYHLNNGRAELAAKYLAQCPPVLKPFAETAIRLSLPRLGIDDCCFESSTEAHESLAASNLPLISYLNDKMRVGRMKDDSMTCTMIGAWLTELILHDESDANSQLDPSHGNNSMLGQFLGANIENMDAKTILKILASHDVGAKDCSTFAAKSGDLGTAVNADLSAGVTNAAGVASALRLLNNAPFELAEPLYYKHALSFLSKIPAQAGESFLSKYSKGLSPLRLLPAMMNYERMRNEKSSIRRAIEAKAKHASGIEESKQAIDIQVNGPAGSADGVEIKLDGEIPHPTSFVDDSGVLVKYLEGVIDQGCRSSAVYRYLLSLYVKLDDEEPLLRFLTRHVPDASEKSSSANKVMLANDSMSNGIEDGNPLDMSYALRTVLSTGRHFRSAVKLYMGFRMRQQAVELALKVDPGLARELAQDSVEIEERKRLWLMIAKNAASGGSPGRDVVARVVGVLKDCGPDVLSIEDVLPFLPDFTRIDEIKDEICEALTSYSTKIDRLLTEMSNCDQTCDRYRSEIKRLRNHQMTLRGDAHCALTKKLVLGSGEPFYVFPSGYVFLYSPLKALVLPYLNSKQKSRVAELENELQYLGAKDKKRNELQKELDGLLAAECPLTGTVMVESIDKDFDDSEEVHVPTQSDPLERVDV